MLPFPSAAGGMASPSHFTPPVSSITRPYCVCGRLFSLCDSHGLFMGFPRQEYWGGGSSRPRDWIHVSCMASRFFTNAPPGKPHHGCISSVAQSYPTLQPHGLQHARLPCLSLSLGAYSNSCPSSRWCHPTISSSVIYAVAIYVVVLSMIF